MSISGTDLVTECLIEARVLSPDETVSSTRLNRAFNKINRMIESWSLENLMIYADVQESFALTAGTAEYTYGSGGDFDSARPLAIRDDVFIRVGSTDYPVRYVDLATYRKQSSKSETTRPRIMAYSAEYTLGKVYLWPTPDTTDSIYIRASKALTSFSDKTTAVNFAPGFESAIIYNGAIELANEYGKTVSPELARLAMQHKQAIKDNNSQPPVNVGATDLARMAGQRPVSFWSYTS